jgi:maleate isomerase
VVSSAGALLKALEDVGAHRVAIITPYLRRLTELVAQYIEASGVAVQDALSLEVSDNVEVGRLDPANLLEHWRRVDLSGCDALVLSACVQMPSLPSIAPVERACGLPVLSAATATTYSILRALDLPTVVPGAGYLLSGQLDPVGRGVSDRRRGSESLDTSASLTASEAQVSPELLVARRGATRRRPVE